MKLDHIALQVENLKVSIEWYQTNLNANITYCDDTWAMLKIGELNLALTLPNEHPPHIAFTVNTPEEIPAKKIKTHRDGSLYTYIEDPSGNIIEYIAWPESSD